MRATTIRAGKKGQRKRRMRSAVEILQSKTFRKKFDEALAKFNKISEVQEKRFRQSSLLRAEDFGLKVGCSKPL